MVTTARKKIVFVTCFYTDLKQGFTVKLALICKYYNFKCYLELCQSGVRVR